MSSKLRNRYIHKFIRLKVLVQNLKQGIIENFFKKKKILISDFMHYIYNIIKYFKNFEKC